MKLFDEIETELFSFSLQERISRMANIRKEIPSQR